MNIKTTLGLVSVSALAIMTASAGWANAAEPQSAAAQPADSTVVVVTGSRIRATGNTLPVPTTVISTEALTATTPTSVQDAVLKLPALSFSTNTPNSSIASNGAGFNAPGNFMDLRGLGVIHTLVMQDGNRVPATFFDGKVDTNMLPQQLMKRVDIVTGGVSSVYGSDAISGVVNFITDTNYIGLKGFAQGGVSTYGDGGSVHFGTAYGTKVGDRGHFEAAAEYYDRGAIDDQQSRSLGKKRTVVVGAGTTTNPFTQVDYVNQSNVSTGGLIRTGPFAGQKFLPDGSLAAFSAGTPTVTSNLAVGGDGGAAINQYLLFHHTSAQVFARFDYDLTDTTHFYVQGRTTRNTDFGANQIYTNVSNATPSNPTDAGGSYPLWIYSDNAFLTAAQRTTLSTAGVTSFALNRMDNDLMKKLAFAQTLNASAFTAGINGQLGIGDFVWDAHLTHGDNANTYVTRNNVNTAKFYAAADAVVDPSSGKTVCRVTLTAPGAFPGCAPLNLFGAGRESDAAMDFVFDDTAYTAKNVLDDVAFNTNGTLFQGWAGPIKFAAGLEYRRETMSMAPTVLDNSFNPQYLKLGPAGNSASTSYPGSNLAYFKEIPAGAHGAADVFERNIELNVPVLNDLPFAKNVTINGAYRLADYNVSGNDKYSNKFSSKTWKVGLDWTVVDGFRIRGTKSRDFRAPTLWELYQAQFISAAGRTDTLTNTAGSINTVTGGNPNLRPEVGDDTTIGFVYQPQFMKNFSVALDAFDLKLTDAIASVNGLDPQAQALCLASNGSSPYCALVVRPISYNNTTPANFPTLIYGSLANTGVWKAKGFDMEVNYRTSFGADSDLAVRLLYSHQSVLTKVSIPGVAPLNRAGTVDQPADKVNLSVTYRRGDFTVDVLQRYISSSILDSNPANIYANPDHVGAYNQTDVNLAYKLNVSGSSSTVFLNINNLFNTTGDVYQNKGYSGSPGLRYPALNYADVIGRYFTVGVRFKY